MFYETLDPLKPSDTGRLQRLVIPSPQRSSSGTISQRNLGGDYGIDFPQTNPRARYGLASPLWYWCVGSSLVDERQGASPQMLDFVLKVDVRSNKTVARWQRKGLSPGEPIFVPKSATQDPLSDDGAIVVHALNNKGQLFGVVLDAATLVELAFLELPVPLMPNVGLHCLWHPNLTATPIDPTAQPARPPSSPPPAATQKMMSSAATPLRLYLLAALSLAAVGLNYQCRWF